MRKALVSESNIQPAEIPQSVQVTLTEWQNWQPISQPTEVVVAANIPVKSESFQTWIELTPEMNPFLACLCTYWNLNPFRDWRRDCLAQSRNGLSHLKMDMWFHP